VLFIFSENLLDEWRPFLRLSGIYCTWEKKASSGMHLGVCQVPLTYRQSPFPAAALRPCNPIRHYICGWGKLCCGGKALENGLLEVQVHSEPKSMQSTFDRQTFLTEEIQKFSVWQKSAAKWHRKDAHVERSSLSARFCLVPDRKTKRSNVK